MLLEIHNPMALHQENVVLNAMHSKSKCKISSYLGNNLSHYGAYGLKYKESTGRNCLVGLCNEGLKILRVEHQPAVPGMRTSLTLKLNSSSQSSLVGNGLETTAQMCTALWSSSTV